MNENNNGKSHFEDDYFNVVSLPVEEQHATTREERNAFFDRLKAQALGKQVENSNDKVLTTDVFGRGYPITPQELDSINLLRKNQEEYALNNPNAVVHNEEKTKYYIVEDGRVFKEVDSSAFYGLDMESMEWVRDQSYMSMFYDTSFKFSELKNFRDYYSEKKREETFGGFPR